MKQSKIKELCLKDMREWIDRIIANEEGTFSSELVCMSEVIEYLEELGWTTKDDFDVNGWQGDMWETFYKDNKEVLISACGFYGGVTIEFLVEE